MRRIATILLILSSGLMFANPIVMPPVISEYYYNDGNWQIEIYFDSEIHGVAGITYINSFDLLCLSSDAGVALFNPGIPFIWDSLYVIDQSWLSSSFVINPDDDYLNLMGYENNHPFWIGEGIYYSTGSSFYPPPGPGESIAIQYVFTVGGDWPEFIQMIQSPVTIGSQAFNVVPNASFSGYVFDQYQNPLEGVEFVYCEPSYCNGYSTPVFNCFQTDETGYFECDSLFPMFHRFDITYEDYIFEEDDFLLKPNQPEYKEYVLLSVGTKGHGIRDEIELYAAPNPFTNKTTFHIKDLNESNWKEARITIRNISGQIVDFIPLTVNPWAGGDISVDWAPVNLPKGIYIYSLIVDGQAVRSGKLVAY